MKEINALNKKLKIDVISGRDDTIDIMKAICVILMVYGHTSCKYDDFIYMFHMPVLLMLSGYCWNRGHASNSENAGMYFLNRTKRLLVPYYSLTVLFVLLNNVFLMVGFYTTNVNILNDNAFLPVKQSLGEVYGNRDFIVKLYKTIQFEYVPQLAGAVWFLYALLVVCLVHCAVERVLYSRIGEEKRIVFYLVEAAFLLLLAWGVSENKYGIRTILIPRHYRLFACYFIFLLGYIIKCMRIKAFGLVQGSISFVVLLIMSQFGTISIAQGNILAPEILMVDSIAGWIMIGSLAKAINYINHPIKKALIFLGKHTIPIILFHFVAFKIVSIIVTKVYNYDYYKVAMYPVIFNTSELIKALYTVVAIVTCLSLYLAFTKVKTDFESIFTNMKSEYSQWRVRRGKR